MKWVFFTTCLSYTYKGSKNGLAAARTLADCFTVSKAMDEGQATSVS